MAMIKDVATEEVQKNLPCVDCVLKEICKYAGTIVPIDNLPELFEVSYVCREKEKYSKSI